MGLSHEELDPALVAELPIEATPIIIWGFGNMRLSASGFPSTSARARNTMVFWRPPFEEGLAPIRPRCACK